jgi:hypothetical protein
VSEKDITEEQVREETISNVNVAAHYLYFAGVIVGAFLLMVALIAVLGSGGG